MLAAGRNPLRGHESMTYLSASNTARRGPPPAASVAAALVLAGLAGCAVGPKFTPPAAPTDTAYLNHPVTDLGSAGAGDAGQHLVMGGELQGRWWTRFNSPDLDRTVDMALAHNWTLEAARANLAAASEQVKVARGGLYPQIDTASSVGQTQYGAAFLGPEAATFPLFSAGSVGLNVGYEVDVFGGRKRKIERSQAMAAFSREGLRAAHLDVARNTVEQAVLIASANAQIEAVGRVIDSDQKTLDLVKAARGAGVVSDIDVTSAQSQLDRDRTLLPPLRQALNAAQDALAVLVGKSPSQWTAPDFTLASLGLPEELPLTVPSELVRARPDIRAAEAQLNGANAAVGVATADLYPKFNLNASVSGEGLVNGPIGPAWSLIGGISAPIFHGGALTAARRAAQDNYRSSFAQYQQTVLVAFGQVATTLHALSNDAEALRTQKQALASADTAMGLASQGYHVGNAGVVQILEAQRLRELAELGLVQARARRYFDTVQLFVVAGGGEIQCAKEPCGQP
jgi:NodT family efflux transporter outer membrane factor (OMF) lipoprotein